MLIYKFDVLEKLREKGISSYSLTKTHGIPPSTVQKLRTGNATISAATIDRLCTLLHCQPGTLLQWVPGGDDEESKP